MSYFEPLNDHHRQLMAFSLLAVWLIVCGVAFWWFQFRHIKPFNEYWATFSGEELAAVQTHTISGKVKVAHFIDPNCPCSRFSTAHIAQLEGRFGTSAEFIDVTSSVTEDLLIQTLRSLPIPAGPAVAIWAGNGELAYFGPYSSGNFCGQGTDFVATTLNSLKAGDNPRWINQEAVGCFCQWSLSATEYTL